MPLLLDTGFIYALSDADDSWHPRSRLYLRSAREVLLVPGPVAPEAAYLLRERLGPESERRFVLALANEEMHLEPLSRSDLRRCAALMEKYVEIGFVDAAVVAIAERLRLRKIATTDRRHFTMIRPVHVPAFELVP